ncbi:GlmU family protein [Muriicola sp. E247]|uniref:GlmU family protein n=1 Tax=Muriicola sp. E247 TaxID=3242730 RepID=UPI0035258EB0
MNYILFDSEVRTSLLPFTFTRPVGEIRVGILTLKEKWEDYLKTELSYETESYLEIKYSLVLREDNLFIDPSFLPSPELLAEIQAIAPETALFSNSTLVAYRSAQPKSEEMVRELQRKETGLDLIRIQNTWDIFSKNGVALQLDYKRITEGRKSAPIPASNRVICPENIFLEEGAKVEYSILNATEGPIYLGKDSEVMEGNMIRGGFALCERAVVKMGAKIYGPTTIGPYGKVCGEINNSVIFGYSSKGHDGYLGNSVLGEWCNIGADSNNSNLKNNYAKVRLWNYATESFDQTGLQFCGLMMGDHSKTAINTMFNTGTVIGVNCNIYVPGFPRNFIPSFSWGGASGFSTYHTRKAFEAAEVMMARRGKTFDEKEAAILEHVFEITKKWRKY